MIDRFHSKKVAALIATVLFAPALGWAQVQVKNSVGYEVQYIDSDLAPLDPTAPAPVEVATLSITRALTLGRSIEGARICMDFRAGVTQRRVARVYDQYGRTLVNLTAPYDQKSRVGFQASASAFYKLFKLGGNTYIAPGVCYTLTPGVEKMVGEATANTGTVVAEGTNGNLHAVVRLSSKPLVFDLEFGLNGKPGKEGTATVAGAKWIYTFGGSR